jgi:zinc transport system ATP-binding protein
VKKIKELVNRLKKDAPLIGVKGPTVECDSLSLSFGKNKVLSDIKLTAKPGELHAIIGPNGGGKSTLIKSILGQMEHSGQITMDWTEGVGTIGYVPQNIMVDKTVPVTVENFITLCIQQTPVFLGLKKDLKDEVNRIVKKLKLDGKEKFLFSELSGGERQRVLFAQALIPKPSLLILDEPMNSIDQNGSEIFAQIIDELKNDGVTVIWVHHDLKEVREKFDRVTCINQTVLFSGAPKDVMDESNLLEIFSAQKSEA